MSTRLLVHRNCLDLLPCCRGFEALSSLGREGERERKDESHEMEELRLKSLGFLSCS